MTTPTFTKEQLRKEAMKIAARMHDGECPSYFDKVTFIEQRLAAFALAQMEGKEEAEAERDEARRELAELIEWRRATSLDELVYGTGAMHEVVDLRVERDRMHTELAEAEDAIRLIERITVTYEDARGDGESEGVAKIGQEFLDHPAVRRAMERKGQNA